MFLDRSKSKGTFLPRKKSFASQFATWYAHIIHFFRAWTEDKRCSEVRGPHVMLWSTSRKTYANGRCPKNKLPLQEVYLSWIPYWGETNGEIGRFAWSGRGGTPPSQGLREYFPLFFWISKLRERKSSPSTLFRKFKSGDRPKWKRMHSSSAISNLDASPLFPNRNERTRVLSLFSLAALVA